jgi:hypothetical protein
MLAVRPGLLYGTGGLSNRVFLAGLYVNLAAAVVASVRVSRASTAAVTGPLVVGLCSLVLCWCLVISASPRPVIDVHLILTDGAKALWKGSNPYAVQYDDIYQRLYGKALYAAYYTPRYLYWPLVLFWQALFVKYADIRWSYVVGHVVGWLGIWRLLTFLGYSRKDALAALLVWLSFPVGFLVLEQAWTDALFVPMVAWGSYWLLRRQWVWFAVALGLLMGVKQYSVFYVLLSCAFVWRVAAVKTALTVLALAGAIFFAVLLPFLVADPLLFLHRTVTDILRYPVRPDALSWPALLATCCGARLPAMLVGSGYAGALSVTLWRIRFQPDFGASDLALHLALVYAVVFLLGKQAFCNYYYFLALLAYILALLHLAPGLADVNMADVGRTVRA